MHVTSVLSSFSCVMAELFTEGSPPFDLSQLLVYRSGDYGPDKLLQKIDDPHIRVSTVELSTVV